ncbi:MAG: Cysteine-rich secretory protein family protein [Syntrophorhabdaceae bacterium PtaU1.Bin034]|nr:MAG: Cysteine-rich secretory protein family protein [Syntrophorhabdaceae bacterium PtaU1.Bin034]
MKQLAATALFVLFVFFPCTFLYSADLNNSQIVKLINSYRKSQGLVPFKENAKLKRSSRIKTDDMVTNRYFGHDDLRGDPFYTNIRRVDYRYRNVGEVLARGCRNEKSVLRVWLNSPPHRAAILDPVFRDIGCSNRLGHDHGFYVVCHLGRTAGR